MSLKIFIGHDTRFPECTDVLADSILRNTKSPAFIEIIPLKLYEIEHKYGLNIKHDPLASTEFTYTRFLVPWLCDYQGIAIFMDNDMLCFGDILDLVADTNHDWLPALWVKKHDHQADTGLKMWGARQTQYPRKNWSSLMVMNCSRLECWSHQVVTEADGARLHRFADVYDELIAEVPAGWNDLEDQFDKNTKLAHWTNGGPWYDKYRDCFWSEKWLNAYYSLTGMSHVSTFSS